MRQRKNDLLLFGKQRVAYSNGLLLPERVARLEASGMVWDAKKHGWEIGFAHFLAQAKLHP